MLLRLLPDQVAKYWDDLGPAIEATLPPIAGESPDKMNNILSAILIGGMVCWLVFRKHSNSIEVKGLVVTTVVMDDCSGTGSLLIYSLYSPPGVELGEDGWREGYEALAKYGRSVGCTRITAYSEVEHIFEMAEKFGGSAKCRFISVPI